MKRTFFLITLRERIIESGFFRDYKNCLTFFETFFTLKPSKQNLFIPQISHISSARHINSFAVVYLDTIALHKSQKFSDWWIYLKLRKCKFFERTMDYLGYVIRPSKLAAAEKNTASVQQATCPTTLTQMRSFLCTCNVYRRFVPKFAGVAAPLTPHTSKNGP